ncbi:MAG TPA: hypothetical protein ENN28_02270 [Candidatus Uhrbacteria bacterium]|nr:hypothetical protein [Candidatus Uhrbacteria bacterium]
MKIYSQLAFGWKYNQDKHQAVIRKKSQIDFIISIIIAFLIIFIVAQFLAYLDKTIQSPVTGKAISFLNPFEIKAAQAANEEAIKMIQSHREINIVKGKGFTFEVGFKNLTNYSWTQKGAKSVDLKIAPPYSRHTIVRHQFWRDESTPAWLKESEAKPGWLAYYRFALEAPKQSGVYTEKFVLVNYSTGKILKGSEFEITLNVWDSESQFPKVQARSGAASQPANQIVAPAKPAPSPAKNLSVDDQGVVLTDQVLLGRTCLDLSVKRFRISTAVSMSLIEDCKRIGIDLTPNIYIDPQDENSGTNSLANPVQPLPPADMPLDSQFGSSDGPIMRIGLFHTMGPITIKANGSFKIKDQNNNILENISAHQIADFNYNFSTQTYIFNSSATTSYLRLIPDINNTVFEIISYESRPAWNPSLNDNKFLGSLEIRYAAQTGRLWVINELPMEIYLKGLAESSNNSPMEYQKALIIAARTYATHHYERQTKHANENFILDAKYDQVYKGYGSQVRLSQVSQAVEETRGLVVTYEDKVAITPYFSHSDGRTRTWSEVWGGNVPWCKGVVEPAGYNKTTLYGHGVGMSAHGAIILAADHGYNYEQILKYYYTGVALKKIY